MNKGLHLLNEIRERQLTRGIRYAAIFGIFPLLFSLSRSFYAGWQNVMYLQIAFYLLIIATSIYRKIIPYTVKAFIILIITFVLGMSGLISWGLVGFGVATFFVFCVLATMLFGTRAGIISAILSTVSIAAVGAGNHYGIITLNFNVSTYLNSLCSWMTGVFGMMIFGGIIVIALAAINSQLVELMQSMNTQTEQLLETNGELKKALDEKSRLEEGLERAKKMEIVGTIAGGVAHDLNNVLAASVTYPELLLMKVAEKSPLRQPLETILKSGLKASAIVHDLLTLARRGVSVAEVSNLNDIAAECAASPEVERIKIFHPGVSLELQLQKKLWNIMGSPFHLMKTITNLVSNAAEAMPTGGKITIETRNQTIVQAIHDYETIVPGEYAVLTVSDSGTGISIEDREKIFEPFYTKKVMGKSGTGLGMTVVWNTVKDHKGFINMDSTEGLGTTFSLYFPLTNQTPAQPKFELPVSKYSGKGESILVVDDVVEQREIASKILTMLGYSVTTASSGREAIEFLKSHSSDLVILDMIMSPGIDGYQTYKAILKLHPRQKAIIVSGYAETDRVMETLKLGAGTYIKKPYLIEKIGVAVRAELDRTKQGNTSIH
jgi:signal transduction histidine kinase/ActR/RegA family two-component response regulator